MIKKFKKFYPEEELIDGFSILCFETAKKLEKFSSSLNKNVQRLILNEVNRSKVNSVNNSTIMSQSAIIAELKSKINNSSNSIPISPTRITAQRKSKPDMNTLSLAIGHNKRRITSTSPIKNLDVKISVEEDRKCSDKENEDIIENNIINLVLPTCQVKVSEVSQDSIHSFDDFYLSSTKEESLTENSMNATSTLSPVSLQPMNCLQGDVESMDLDSNDVNSNETESNLVKLSTNSCHNIPEISVIDDFIETSKNSTNRSEKEEYNLEEDDDDDCLITSIGFDPSPKLSGITLSSVSHMLLDIPVLKPAPPFTSSPSIKTILLQNFKYSPPPPPLTPAPSCYFISNLMVCNKSNNKIDEYKNNPQKSVDCPKLKFHRKSIMKSSILKSSSKCSKTSSNKLSHNERPVLCSPDNLQNPVIKSILQNTNHLSNATPSYSPNYLKYQNLKSITPINNSKDSLYKPVVTNISYPPLKKISKLISSSTSDNKEYGSFNKRNFSKQPFIRKTKNHIDISNWIYHKTIFKMNINHSRTVNYFIHKPQVVKPLYRQVVPLGHLRSTNHINPLNARIPLPPLNFNEKFRFQNKQSIMPINNLFKSHNDPQVFIRPLNSVNNTTLTPTNTIFLNSTLPNSFNYCTRPNLLLLQ